MKISTLLRKAANNHLWVGGKYYNQQGEVFSCIAVTAAINAKYPISKWWPSDRTPEDRIALEKRDRLSDKAMAFLNSLGCATYSTKAFSEFKGNKQRQAARYAWLMFAAQVAEEEGL